LKWGQKSVVEQKSDKPQFPRLLICEGLEDRLFFQRLIDVRELPRFHILPSGGN